MWAGCSDITARLVLRPKGSRRKAAFGWSSECNLLTAFIWEITLALRFLNPTLGKYHRFHYSFSAVFFSLYISWIHHFYDVFPKDMLINEAPRLHCLIKHSSLQDFIVTAPVRTVRNTLELTSSWPKKAIGNIWRTKWLMADYSTFILYIKKEISCFFFFLLYL